MKPVKTIIICLLITSLFSFKTKAQSNALSNSVNTIITNYLSLKTALAGNDGNTAENKAKDLLAAINTVPKKDMDAKQLMLWNTYQPKLEFDSRHISEVNFVHHQREHFASLSNNLYTVLKGLKLNKIVLYRQYCKAEKQYFLSETTTGKDPYMGMTGCSKTTETLPAAK